MHQRTFHIPRTGSFSEELRSIANEGIAGDPERTLIIVNESSSSAQRIDDDLAALRAAFPHCQIAGMTTAGPSLLGADPSSVDYREGLEISILTFETSSFTVLRYDRSIMTGFQVGQRFSDDLASIPHAKGALVFTPGSDFNPDLFLSGLEGDAARIPLFGTVAAKWEAQEDDPQFAIADGRPVRSTLVAVVFHGPDLHVTVDSCFGWHAVGKRMQVTAGTDDGFITEIDHMKPIDLYKRYLHIDTHKPGSLDTCSFPLIVFESDGLNARIPHPNERGDMCYGSKNPVGLSVSIGSANESALLQSTLDMSNRIARFRPQALLGSFCLNRRIFLGTELSQREFGYIERLQPSAVISCGYGEVLHVDGHGRTRHCAGVVAALREGEPQGTAPVIADDGIAASATANPRTKAALVTLLEEATKDLERAAHIDNLTGLANRPAVEEWVTAASHALEGDETIEAVMFDLDNFKSINDGFGHDVGDAVLMKVANAMRHYAYRRSIMGRWGGDEFVFFTAGSSLSRVAAHMEELRREIASTDFSPVDHVTLSVGIASMKADDDFHDLYKRIDRAMYRSKHLGGDRVTVYSDAYRTEISAPESGHYFSLQERAAYESSNFPLLVYQIVHDSYVVIAVSEGYCKMVGAPRQEMMRYLNGKSLGRIYPADQPRMILHLEDMQKKDTGALLYRLLIDGTYHTLLALCRSQRTEDGSTIVVAHYLDLTVDGISLRKLLDMSASMEIGGAAPKPGMRKGTYRFTPDVRRTLESSRFPFAVMQLDNGSYRAILVSDGACQLYGEQRDDLVAYLSNKSYKKTHPDDAGRLMAAAREISANPNQSIVCRLMVNGEYHPVLFYQKLHYGTDGTPLYVVAYIDLMDTNSVALDTLTSYVADQREMLFKDEVTGLPNAIYFRTFGPGIVKEMFARHARPWAVFVNLRGMHSYNEQHGYAAGDELLARTARALRKEFPDDQAIRYSEDRFVVLTARDDVACRIAAVNRAVAQVAGSGGEMVVAGAYAFKSPEESPSRAIDRARQAASLIRNNRKETFLVFDESIKSRYQMRDYVLGHWRQAIDEGWIETYFQPIQGLLSNKIAGVEALARWKDPTHGVLSPAVFVPVLEDHHLIWELDRHVLRQACAFQGARKRRGLTYVPLSVNLSRSDFSVPNLHETISQVIAENGLAPADVAIEITETALVHHEELIKEHIARFHEDGHLVYLDDFGSGYSTLNSLQKFDFDVLKIDMMFLRNATEKTPVILAESIDMAKRLHMMPLMEGVETEAERDFLRIAGCARAQGYLISKPLPPAELVAKLDAEGLAPITPEQNAFFTATARANMADARMAVSADEYVPTADEHPVFVFSRCMESGRISVLYANEAAREAERLQGYDDLSRFATAMNEGGAYFDLVVKSGFAEAARTRSVVFRDLDTPGLKARLRISLLAEENDMQSFFVVGHDTYVPHAMSSDGKNASYWKFRKLHPSETVED